MSHDNQQYSPARDAEGGLLDDDVTFEQVESGDAWLVVCVAVALNHALAPAIMT